jgi:hypothetical protein
MLTRALGKWKKWAPVDWNKHNIRLSEITTYASGGTAVTAAITAPFLLAVGGVLVGSIAGSGLLFLLFVLPPVASGLTCAAKLSHAFMLNRLKKMDEGVLAPGSTPEEISRERQRLNFLENKELFFGALFGLTTYELGTFMIDLLQGIVQMGPAGIHCIRGLIQYQPSFLTMNIVFFALNALYDALHEYWQLKQLRVATVSGNETNDETLLTVRRAYIENKMYSSLYRSLGWWIVAGGTTLLTTSTGGAILPFLAVVAGLGTVAYSHYRGNQFTMFDSSHRGPLLNHDSTHNYDVDDLRAYGARRVAV